MVALRRLRVHGIVIAVGGAETPAALLEAADLVVEGPPGVLDLLRQLAPAART